MIKSRSKLQIIEAAATTFSRYGFKKTTMDDIAFTAGKGKSSLYYYFKNKEDVFEAVAQHEAEILQLEIEKELEKIDTAVNKLRSYIRLRMRRFAAKGTLYTALSDNFLATFSFIEKIRNNYQAYEKGVIAEILQIGIENGEFKPVDVHFTGEAILTCMIGFEVPLITKTHDLNESEKKINEVIDMFFFGLCT